MDSCASSDAQSANGDEDAKDAECNLLSNRSAVFRGKMIETLKPALHFNATTYVRGHFI